MEGCDTHRRLWLAYGKGKSNPAKLYDNNMTATSLLQSKYYFCLADRRCSLPRSLSFCLIWMEWFSLTWKQEAPTTCNSPFCLLEKNRTPRQKVICVLGPSCAEGKGACSQQPRETKAACPLVGHASHRAALIQPPAETSAFLGALE